MKRQLRARCSTRSTLYMPRYSRLRPHLQYWDSIWHTDSCLVQTKGFSGSVFKSFAKLEDAQQFISTKGAQDATPEPNSSAEAPQGTTEQRAAEGARPVPKSKQGSTGRERKGTSCKGTWHVTAAALLDGLPCRLVGQHAINPDAEYRLVGDPSSRHPCLPCVLAPTGLLRLIELALACSAGHTDFN